MGSLITIGLKQILVGTASASGTMPTDLKKIGKVYNDTANLTQDEADVTEHFEEGAASPEVRKVKKKIPKLTFDIMDADTEFLAKYVGGTHTAAKSGSGAIWGFDGTEKVSNFAIKVESEQGLDFLIPNASIDARIDDSLTANGIHLVHMTVTPCAVSAGKPISAVEQVTASA